MKILWTSDWQIGAGATLGTAYHGPGSRFQDQVDGIRRIGDTAVTEQVAFVGVLGDVFERSRPAPHEILAVQDFVRRMLTEGIRVLFLLGNHDADGNALPSALEIFATTGCVVCLQPGVFTFDDCVIATLPWTPPGRIVAAMPDAERDDINDAAARGLVTIAQGLKTECDTLAPDLPSILLTHWAISGVALPTGLDTSMLREPVIDQNSLGAVGYSLVMSGHIHSAGVFATDPTPMGYCGSPYVCDWGESEVAHGVWIYDTEGAGHLRFVPIEDNKRFVTLEIDPFGAYPDRLVNEGDSVVRVKYSVTEEEARRVDQAALRARLFSEGAVKVVFKPSIVREQRARVAEIADEVSELDALGLWITSQQVPEGEAAALRSAHAEFLERVE